MDWQNIEAALDRAVFGTFAEPVRLSFFKSGVLDATRPMVTINAILHSPSVDGAISLGKGMVTTISASSHALVIERAAYPDLVLPNSSTEKTKVRATSRPGTPLFEVAKVSDRHSGIILLELNVT